MSNHKSLIGFGLMAALSVGVAAEQRPNVRLVPAPKPTITFAAPVYAGNAEGKTKVVGTVVDLRQVPVKGAKVQLRSLTTGNVIAESRTDDLGGYEFEVLEPGTFVVEMVLADGYVVALSNAGSLAQYETLQTLVQLPGRWDLVAQNVVAVNNATEYLGMSSAMTITSQTITIAGDQSIPPVNPGEPVSPR